MEKSFLNPHYKIFLRELRRARHEAGLSQAELARRLEQTQSFISKCERGERRIDAVELRAFCKALGVPMIEFIGRLEKAILDENE